MCGITLSLYHHDGWHATDHFAPLQDDALEAVKRRENACIKALVFTAQASCGFNLLSRLRWVACTSVFVLNIHLPFFA